AAPLRPLAAGVAGSAATLGRLCRDAALIRQRRPGAPRMTLPAADINLDVNLRNPGQFFACCGVLELAGRIWPESEEWFGRSGSGNSFHIATYSGHNDPLGEIVRRLCESDTVVALADDHAA